jgi:hypothetical protein
MPKQTQGEANYGRGDPIDHCGICRYYQGSHRCSQVMGYISPFGISDVYAPDKNPFGPTLSAREKQAIKAMAADGADRSAMAGQAMQA